MSLVLKNILVALADFPLEMTMEMRGRVTVIFGPSGAGKTSLLDLVAGLRQAKSAFVQLDGRVLTDTGNRVHVPAHQRDIGYVPQDLALFPHLSVRQNLLYGCKASDKPGGITFERVASVLEIESLVDRAVTKLSGGEQQRVALGRALVASPKLLLLDEPLASLDAALKARILPYLIRIRDEFGVPMIFVTHDRAEAMALADEMVVLIGGKVVQAGPVAEVFSQPVDAEVAKYVGMETLQSGLVQSVKDGLATVAAGNVTLTALAPESASRAVFVCIRGEDVILQREAVANSSVRNRLASRVVSIRQEGPLVRVELYAGFPLFALVTRPAAAELALREGDDITALIKAQAIHLVPR